MKNKILLVSLLSLLAFNVNAEEPVAGNKNFVELEIGQGFGNKYKYYIDDKLTLQHKITTSVGIVYLRSITDETRLRIGLHYDPANITYASSGPTGTGTYGGSNIYQFANSETLDIKNTGGFSVGAEHDLYKTQNFSFFASWVVNFNYISAQYNYIEKDTMTDTDINDSFNEKDLIMPAEIGFGGLYNISQNFSVVTKVLYVTPASMKFKHEDSKYKVEMGNYGKATLALRYGF